LRQGLKRIAGRHKKHTKAGGKERPKEAPLPPFAFVVFCGERYERKARSRPNKKHYSSNNTSPELFYFGEINYFY